MKLDKITLPSCMQWEDKYSSHVTQDYIYSLQGSIIYKNSLKTQGIPITLKSMGDTGWLTKHNLDALQALADDPNGKYTLTVHGKTFTVIFDHKRGGINATPVFPTGDEPSNATFYIVTLYLITVGE